MAIVKRGNCEFTVADHQVEEYLAKGYSLLNDKGDVIRKKTPQTVKEYKTENEKLSAENQRLTAENAELHLEVMRLTALIGQHESTSDASDTDNPPANKKK